MILISSNYYIDRDDEEEENNDDIINLIYKEDKVIDSSSSVIINRCYSVLNDIDRLIEDIFRTKLTGEEEGVDENSEEAGVGENSEGEVGEKSEKHGCYVVVG